MAQRGDVGGRENRERERGAMQRWEGKRDLVEELVADREQELPTLWRSV